MRLLVLQHECFLSMSELRDTQLRKVQKINCVQYAFTENFKSRSTNRKKTFFSQNNYL